MKDIFFRKIRVAIYTSTTLFFSVHSTSVSAETRPVLGDERWVCQWTKTSDKWGGTYANVIVHEKVFLEYNPFVDKDTPQWKRTKMPYGPQCTFAEGNRRQIFEKRSSSWYYKGSDVAIYTDNTSVSASPSNSSPSPTVATPPLSTVSANAPKLGATFVGSNKEGWHNNREFVHPELKIRFTYPENFVLTNSPEAIEFKGASGDAVFTTTAYSGDLEAYLKAVVASLKNGTKPLEAGPIQIGVTNGLKSGRTSAVIMAKGQQRRVTAVAYELSPTQAFHFLSVSDVGNDSFEILYNSFRQMSAFEADDIIRRGPG